MAIDGNGIAVAILKLFCDYYRTEKISKCIYFHGYQGGSHIGEERHIGDGSGHIEHFGGGRLHWSFSYHYELMKNNTQMYVFVCIFVKYYLEYTTYDINM